MPPHTAQPVETVPPEHGPVLRAAREAAGVTLRELARGISDAGGGSEDHSHLSRFEAGLVGVSFARHALARRVLADLIAAKAAS
jgi:transcriptional regulator with XRE-family HTH domain